MKNRATSEQGGTVAGVVGALGGWSDGRGPLYRKLARAFSSAIERGGLPDGCKLPSERDLAGVLAVGRGTAVAAYDRLVADGLVERRRGSGTYVTAELSLPPGREGSALVHRLVEQSRPDPDLVDLSIAVLHDPSDLPAVSVSTADLRDVVPDTGHSPWGLDSLRRSIASHVTDWGLPTEADQIVITTGAQQAISAAAACWLRPGDTAVVDDPTYPGALAALRQAGARVVGAAVDRHGVRCDSLGGRLRARPALAYLQSTVHSPTGAVLADRRRPEIAELVRESRVPLIEDLALADLAWQDSPPPVASFLPSESVALVGSLSKLFWGGLRVGFVRAPAPLALRFARIKATHDLGSSVTGQLMAERLLASAPASQLRARKVEQLRHRYETLAAALGRLLPAWSWPEPSGGLCVWVRIPAPSSEAFAQAALRSGVAVATPEALSPSDDHRDRLRISFAGSPAQIEEGVARLAHTWRSAG